jgi:hypothetical protein
MLRDLRVIHFVLIYALIQISTYGAIFYLPAEVSALITNPQVLLWVWCQQFRGLRFCRRLFSAPRRGSLE